MSKNWLTGAKIDGGVFILEKTCLTTFQYPLWCLMDIL
jgi:hypothetical protein